MAARFCCILTLLAFWGAPLSAKDKHKINLPDYVLQAHTVVVVIAPGAGEPVDEPNANAAARENVEKALLEWGRLKPMMEGQEADLVIAIRAGSGRAVRPTIKGAPGDQRPGVGQTTDSSVRIGGQMGQPPPLSQSTPYPQSGPRVSNEVGGSEDTFAVYRGGVEYPLDSPAVWRYEGRDCLRLPKIIAVEEFRKALAEADKQRQSKKP